MRYRNSSRHERAGGFVALIAVLILSALLLIIVVSLSRYGVMARFALLDIERKTESELIASSCIAVARIMAVDDPLVTTALLTVPVNERQCTIESIVGVGTTRRAKVSAEIGGATSNYLVDIDPVSGRISRFIELVE